MIGYAYALFASIHLLAFDRHADDCLGAMRMRPACFFVGLYQ